MKYFSNWCFIWSFTKDQGGKCTFDTSSTFSAPQYFFSTSAPFQHLCVLQVLRCSYMFSIDCGIKVIATNESHVISIRFFHWRQDYFEKITFFYKTWLKVSGVEESESVIGFSKFWVWLFSAKKNFLLKVFFCKKFNLKFWEIDYRFGFFDLRNL
jgi:hypothetical protein